MGFSPAIDRLMEALRCLPGVGPKSAQRMTLHVLQRDPEGGRELARALEHALEHVGRCRSCRNLSEHELCTLCASPDRDRSSLCVVESPADVLTIDRATGYKGLYFVLLGRLSPLDGIGPGELGLELLAQRLDSGEVRELILATNPTVEGEATAHYIGDMARQRGVRASRIAHGIPLGGELEFVDGGTLSHAFADRRDV